MAHLTEALADAMNESYGEICSISETDTTVKGAKGCGYTSHPPLLIVAPPLTNRRTLSL
jgi:hypothetical protein